MRRPKPAVRGRDLEAGWLAAGVWLQHPVLEPQCRVHGEVGQPGERLPVCDRDRAPGAGVLEVVVLVRPERLDRLRVADRAVVVLMLVLVVVMMLVVMLVGVGHGALRLVMATIVPVTSTGWSRATQRGAGAHRRSSTAGSPRPSRRPPPNPRPLHRSPDAARISVSGGPTGPRVLVTNGGPMRRILTALLASASTTVALLAAGGGMVGAAPAAQLVPLAVQAPGGPVRLQASWLADSGQAGWSGCNAAGGNIQCYIPSDIREAYGVDQLGEKGDGQTIVLVDSYGDPQAAAELQQFHDDFFPTEPPPNFDAVFPVGKPDYSHGNPGASGNSGPGSAAGWATEAALDVQWAYAIAPHAHIVLLAVPPAETLGVQGFPNLFKAMSWAVDNYPAGTIFSMSLGVSEPTFGGAAASRRPGSTGSSRRATPWAIRSSRRPVMTARPASRSSRRTPVRIRSRRPAGRPRART